MNAAPKAPPRWPGSAPGRLGAAGQGGVPLSAGGPTEGGGLSRDRGRGLEVRVTEGGIRLKKCHRARPVLRTLQGPLAGPGLGRRSGPTSGRRGCRQEDGGREEGRRPIGRARPAPGVREPRPPGPRSRLSPATRPGPHLGRAGPHRPLVLRVVVLVLRVPRGAGLAILAARGARALAVLPVVLLPGRVAVGIVHARRRRGPRRAEAAG
ncbi:hypothetical protein MC885_012242 [Smutsia gigantea]|nr:hypothetical protein MC885_012242 [Smutsia gigantea]